MSRITGLLNDPKEPSILYAVVEHFQAPSAAADERSGVYWSRDGGRTFTGLRDGLPSPVFQLVLDPKDPHKLYAATEWNGVYTFTRPK
jgi:hypothetical protein